MQNLSIKKIIFGIVGIIAAIFLIAYAGKLAEDVSAGEIVVIQDPIDGDLHVYTNPGVVGQNFGTATHYKKSTQLWFTKVTEHGDTNDQSIKVRFNDGGHANISGSVRIDLPLSEKEIIALHTTYGSQTAVETQLVKTVIEKSVYMTGPLMSSKESYAEKRNDLISFIDDQAVHGVYKTTQREVKGIDPISGVEKTNTIVEISKSSDGKGFLRQEQSPIEKFHLNLYNFSINSIDYDATVDAQIASQQKAMMQVQTAMANAKRAEQDAVTVEMQGKADAAKAKWEQEVLKARAVTEAQQKKEVAELDAKTAAAEKQANILRGEGEGAYKRLIIQADGALNQKLATYERVQKNWADAFAAYTGNIVPQFQTGGGTGGNGALNFMEIMGAKAARDLSLDLSTKK